MIRRGLQLVVGVGILMMLGAAPCLAVLGAYVDLQGFPTVSWEYNSETGTMDLDGRYYEMEDAPGNYTRTDENGMTRVYSFSDDGIYVYVFGPPFGDDLFYWAVFNSASGEWYMESDIYGFGPPTENWSVTGANGLSFGTVEPDPFEQAFPDWESAAVKIPLGFSFAMAFWGVAVAASVSMKWVRDLASAAS